jgi:hypothetical protein
MICLTNPPSPISLPLLIVVQVTYVSMNNSLTSSILFEGMERRITPMANEEVNQKIESIAHPKVRNIVRVCVEQGCRFKAHPSNPNLVNLFDPARRKNIIGDINLTSPRGYFTLEVENGRFKSFRNEVIGLDIDQAEFEESVLKRIKR